MDLDIKAELGSITDSSSTFYELEAKKSSYTLTGVKLVVAEGTFLIMTILMGLDISILNTALVPITSEFNAVDDIPWIGTSYFISQSCSVLLYGKILTFTPPKLVLSVALGVFILGSFVCGIAPTIVVLLLGRGIAGLGAAGILVAALLIIAHISTPSQRSLLIGLVMSVYAISIMVGPTIGGALTERFNFRWCFLINLPIGSIAALALMFFVPNVPCSTPNHELKRSLLGSWLRIDWIGVFLNTSGVFLLLIGLQWGGNTRPWSDPGVIATLVIGGVFSCLFIVWEARLGSEALLPIDLFKRRNISGSFLSVLFSRWCAIVATIYLSVLYQLQGFSATAAGVRVLSISAGSIVSNVLCGFVVGRTRNIWIWMFLPPFMATIAFVLLAAVPAATTSAALLVVCQILIGFGLGPVPQNCILVAQAEFVDDEDKIPQATSLISFATVLSATLGSSVGGSIFEGTLQNQINHLRVNIPAKVRALVLENIEAVLELPPSFRVPVIEAYTVALKRNFFTLIFISALTGLFVLLIERKRLPKSISATES